MSGFWIYALFLTLAYAGYYSVVVIKGLWGRSRDGREDSGQTFGLEDMRPEPGRAVVETDRGFLVDGSPEMLLARAQGDGFRQGREDPGPKLDASGAPVSPAEAKAASVLDDMDEIVPESSGEMTHRMLFESIVSGGADVAVTPAGKEEEDHD